MSNDQSFSFTVWDSGPESPLITMWKVVVFHSEPDWNDAAFLMVDVENTCPPGGGPPHPVADDYSSDTRKRIRLTTPQIANKCLRVTVSTPYVPAGQTRNVVACDYFHSDPMANH